MYKKPISETTPIESAYAICALSEGGNTSETGGGPVVGSAPKRKTEVF